MAPAGCVCPFSEVAARGLLPTRPVEGARLFLLAAIICVGMGGLLFASVQAERTQATTAAATASAPPSEVPPSAPALDTASEPRTPPQPPLPEGVDPPDLTELALLDDRDLVAALARLEERDRLAAIAESNARDIVLDDGVRIGPFTLSDPNAAPRDARPRPPTKRRRARRPPRAAAPPIPRLHPDPGQHTILVARRMIASGELIQGSCYRYLSEVFERAGHGGWRRRTIVYRAGRDGPYADLDRIRPGDWLYIVTDPDRTPVGTHSVLFVRWRDRARGYAETISHAGWGPPRAGRVGGHDVTRTYRIIRPTL